MRILIVDDSLEVRNLLQYIMTGLGHAVVGHAKDGVEAVEMALLHQPDVITMDIHMPRMNGIEAIRALEAEGCPSRIIVITGESEIIAKIIEMKLKHVVKCLAKPFSLAEITRTLDNIVRKCS